MERIRSFFSILLTQTLIIWSIGSTLSTHLQAEVNDQSAYNSAFQLMEDQKFKQALDQMIDFTQQYPESELVVDAIFWTGQLEYVLDYETFAIQTFAYLLRNYPNSRRYLQTQVKMGQVLVSYGRLTEGLSAFAKTIDVNPA